MIEFFSYSLVFWLGYVCCAAMVMSRDVQHKGMEE